MAYQHLYSSVPARASIYNRTDGFDTFAHSAALDREFILGELSAIYADKLNKNNPVKIRRAELPTVYTQSVLPSGRTVQSALTYLPLDYTGERSAYMVHSLVLSDDDRARIFANPAALSFNPEMFITDITRFNLTAPTAQPIRNYPEVQYIPRPISRLATVTGNYHPEMLSRLVFAIVHSLTGKGRDVYVRLPLTDRRASSGALELVNALLNILPYNLRELLSFVTYVSHYDNYPGFKLKFVSMDCPVVPVDRGIFFDFEAGTISGMGKEIEMHRPLVGFLYSLFDNATVRDAFHLYTAQIMASYPDKLLNLTMLNELVFMFWQCSGFYSEQSVLPSDELLYEFLSIYEKYRNGLTDDYRKRAYKCLERYPNSHTPIPERIFSKLALLYPEDSIAAKRVALGVVLKLIHTDIMRERLFGFIKGNYDSETPEVKGIINADLTRVFYGGFLQQDLLAFFDKNFDSEPKATQNVILAKLLLSVRTPAVQDKIISFLDDHYDALEWEQKLKIYSTAMEMLPECDRLTSMFVWFINKHVGKEREALTRAISTKVTEYLSEDYKKDYHLLLPQLVYSPGFLEDVVIKLLCTHWKDSIVSYEYAILLDARSSYQKAKKLLHFYDMMGDESVEVIEKLLPYLGTLLLDTAATLYDYMKLDGEMKRKLPEALYRQICENMIYPAAVYSAYDVFKVRYGKEGIDTLLQYAAGKPVFTESDGYKTVLRYIELTRRAEAEDALGTFLCIEDMPTDARVRLDIANHIRMCSLNKSRQSPKTILIYEMCMNYLKSASFRFDAIYQQYKKNAETQLLEDSELVLSDEKLDKASAAAAIEMLLECAIEMCGVSDSYVDMICNDSYGFPKAIKSFILSYGIGGGKFLLQRCENAPFCIVDLIKDLVRENKPQGKELVQQIINKVNVFKK